MTKKMASSASELGKVLQPRSWNYVSSSLFHGAQVRGKSLFAARLGHDAVATAYKSGGGG